MTMFGRRARKGAVQCGVLMAMALSCCRDQPRGESHVPSALDASVATREHTHDSSSAEQDPAVDATAPAPQLDAGFVVSSDPDAAAALQDGGAETAREPLLLPDDWVLLSAAEDTFDDRPALATCWPAAVAAEVLSAERVLGIDTGNCNYATAAQPTLRAIAAGETIKVRLWHFDLTAPEPAEAHAALIVDDLTVLDEHVTIPQPGGLIVKYVRVDRPVPVGSRALFHLHNHGANSWALVEVSVGP